MVRLHLSFLLILILLTGRSQAQSYDENNFTRYTRVQGLSGNYITGIVQDSIGYIWVGTAKGLNRFDGRFFTCYYRESPDIQLPGNRIFQLSMQGRRIIGATELGAFVYDTRSRLYKQLVIPCSPAISSWANSISSMTSDRKGDYILSTKTGLFVFDSSGKAINRYDHYLPADAGRVELWFGGGLSELDNGLILQQNEIFFSAYDPTHNRIDTLYGAGHPSFKKAITDRNGGMRGSFPAGKNKLFIIDQEKNTLDLFDFHEDSLYKFPLPFNAGAELENDFSTAGYSNMTFLSDSLLALTCKVSGFYLLTYHAATHQLSIADKKYFDDKHCTAVFRDREGRLWVGTSDGLYKENLSNPFFKASDLAEQLPELKNHDIRAICANHSKLFLGLRNKGGILVLDKATQRLEHRLYLGGKDSMCNNISLFFPYNRDTLWVGTRAGLFWLDQHNYSSGRIATPPSLNWINTSNILYFLEDSHRNIWISLGRLNSVVYYNRDTHTFTDISHPLNPLLKITYCFSMAEDQQSNIWLACDGLCRWNRRTQTVDTLIPHLSVAKSLSSYLSILGRDNSNNLWIYSATNGMIQYNCTTNTMFLRMEENGLTGDGIEANSPLIRDHIWLGTENGISAFDIRDYSNRVFSYSDGLPDVSVTTTRRGSWYDAEENIMYLGSRHHLISFAPDLSQSPERTPALFIDEISTPEGILQGNPDRIELTYSGNSARLGFNALNFGNPEDNRFAYRVTPSPDSSWHMLNWQRNVNFNNLAPGEYHVQLKLFSAINRWPDQVKDLLLIVHPPFWKRGWFIALSALIVLLAIGMIYRNRVQSMREKLSLDMQLAEYEMKALHAQMNPHFIFNSLNSIREMILNGDNRNASRYLSRFSRLIRLNLEHSKQAYITMQQNIEYLESYLEIEQLRFADFTYSIGTSREIDRDEIRLAPMLIQPLVENAIWHGLLSKEKEKWVRIYFYLDEEKLVCEIEDNGIGIRQSLNNKTWSQADHESIGIGNIRQRIAVLNEKYRIDCSLSIKDKADIPGRTDSGTLITLVLPAHEQELIITKKSL